jgi:hypothetical protein
MYAHDLLCPTDPWKPEYVGFCERCGFKWPFAQLQFQYEWRGQALVSLNILVCPRCLDVPQENLRPVIIGPDSLPPKPRPAPNFYQQQEAGTGLTGPATTQLQVLGDEGFT